jgi:hypothetical protein
MYTVKQNDNPGPAQGKWEVSLETKDMFRVVAHFYNHYEAKLACAGLNRSYDKTEVQPVLDAAIAAEPRPLMFVVTLPSSASQYAFHEADEYLRKFAATHSLPPFLMVIEGMKVETVAPASELASLRSTIQCMANALEKQAKEFAELRDIHRATYGLPPFSVAFTPPDIPKEDLAKIREQVEKSLTGPQQHKMVTMHTYTLRHLPSIGTQKPQEQTAPESDRCPRDTNGDGDCGQTLCPVCGPRISAKSDRCSKCQLLFTANGLGQRQESGLCSACS